MFNRQVSRKKKFSAKTQTEFRPKFAWTRLFSRETFRKKYAEARARKLESPVELKNEFLLSTHRQKIRTRNMRSKGEQNTNIRYGGRLYNLLSVPIWIVIKRRDGKPRAAAKRIQRIRKVHTSSDKETYDAQMNSSQNRISHHGFIRMTWESYQIAMLCQNDRKSLSSTRDNESFGHCGNLVASTNFGCSHPWDCATCWHLQGSTKSDVLKTTCTGW